MFEYVINLLISSKNKKKNILIVSGKQYIRIVPTQLFFPVKVWHLVRQSLKKAKQPGEKETATAKAGRLTRVEAAKEELEKAKITKSTCACLAYDLFRKLLRDDPETQWDQIVSEMHTKNPWEDLTGAKRNGLCAKSQLSLIECIEFHKLAFFSVDAAERLKYYLMCIVKQPMKWTIRMHVTRMETLNKYLGILPTIKNSPLAVASMEFGNVPFTEATHASIILSHLPVAWRHQYDLTHKTVPESPRVMLLDLKNIKKLFVERYNKKARANKAKAASATKAAELKKGRSAKYCKWCKAADGPFTTHDTSECRRFSKDGSPKDKPTKPFDTAKKTWKKTGSGDSSQMTYLTEKVAKLEKKLKKSKKHGKKRARDSSDSDSDSD